MYFNGLVLLGKFTGLSPIFHGKIYGFRFRFSQQNQSKKMYCSILTGGMIWKRIHLNIHINFRRLLPVPDLYISMIYIYIYIYIYIIFLNKNLKLVSTPMGHHDIHIIASQLAQQLPRLARPGTSSRIHRSTGPSNVCARRAVKGWRKVGPGDSVGHLLSSG